MRTIITATVIGFATVFSGHALANDTQPDVYGNLGAGLAGDGSAGLALGQRTAPVAPDVYFTLGIAERSPSVHEITVTGMTDRRGNAFKGGA
jgi:hypothetical protein